MKIALYIEDGYEQIVLTPETPTEKSIVGKLLDGSRQTRIYRGSFYHCQGGWLRHKEIHGAWDRYDKQPADESVMIVLEPIKEDTPPTPAPGEG